MRNFKLGYFLRTLSIAIVLIALVAITMHDDIENIIGRYAKYFNMIVFFLATMSPFFVIIANALDGSGDIRLSDEELKQDISKAVNPKSEDGEDLPNAITLMERNLYNIEKYYTWSYIQGKTAFSVSIAMSFLGFLLIVATIALTVMGKLTNETAVIPAIGGIVIELLAGTVMIIYRESLNQLNRYHSALHEDERFLSCVNLLNQYPAASDKAFQIEMLREVIRGEISMNLSEFSNPASKEKKNEKKDKPDNKQKDKAKGENKTQSGEDT